MKLLKLAVAALVTLALASCGGEQKLRMGVAGPLKGKDAVFGAQLKNGVEQAIDDINAAAVSIVNLVVLNRDKLGIAVEPDQRGGA